MKSGIRIAPILAIAVAASISSFAAAGPIVLMDFEVAVGNDAQPISTFYSGITFTADSSGSEWVFRDGTTGSYNVSSWPSGTILGSNGEYWIHGSGAATTALDDTGNNGRIAFDNEDATFVELAYSFNDFSGQGNNLTLTAYDTNDNVLDMDSGAQNLRFIHGNSTGPGTLYVEAPVGQFISYVIVSDSGNYWVIDNVRTDASGIIAPTTGGCCFPDGTCLPDQTQDECESQSGAFWYGPGTTCDLDCLSFALGACCLPDGSCSSSEDMLFCEEELGGIWQGPETLCSGVSCKSFVPPNDYCEDAIPVSSFGFPEYGSTLGATEDEIPDCEGLDRGFFPAGVWYSVIGNGSILEASVCVPDVNPTRGGRSYLYVFCGGCDDLTCVAGDGGSQVWSCLDSGRSLDAVQWCSEQGREYLIFVSLESVGQADFLLTVDDLEDPCEAVPCGIPNDDCVDAIELFTDDDYMFGSSNNAQPDDVPSCIEMRDGRGINGVWYKVQGNGNILEVDVCAFERGKGAEASVSVYCGSCQNLQCVASNVEFAFECPRSERSSGIVSWCSEQGRTYYILVTVYGPEFGIRVRDTYINKCEPEPCGVEQEDFCEDAQLVCPGETYFGHTFDATSDYLDHGGSFDTIFFCGMFFGVYDVWYKYIPAEDGLLFVHIEGPPTEYVFGVYDDCRGLPEDLLACNIARHHGVIVFWVNAFETYYIRAAGTYFSRGEFELDLVAPPCANGIPSVDWDDRPGRPFVTLPR